MNIHQLFSTEVSTADALAAARRSLRKRDRRIGFLLRRLRQTRADAALKIARKDEVIAGLEQALLSHAPTIDAGAEERIADLEAQLSAMTALAETLSDRAPEATALRS